MAAGAPEGEEDRKMSSSGGLGAGGPGPEVSQLTILANFLILPI